MDKFQYRFDMLPLEKLEADPNQPRKELAIEGAKNKLKLSIEKHGIRMPICVCEQGGRYIIMDGHRRYECAKALGLTKIPCLILPPMTVAQFEILRYEVQNNRRSWKPIEKSELFHRIKNEMNYTNKQLAECLNISATPISNALQLRALKLEYLKLMGDLNESYQVEFVRLKNKLRKIRDFEVNRIIQIIFDKVNNKVIRTSRDFRRLGSIFLRATANEGELYNFLSDPDMTVNELQQKTIQSGSSKSAEEVIASVSHKLSTGIAFSVQELMVLKQLSLLLSKISV